MLFRIQITFFACEIAANMLKYPYKNYMDSSCLTESMPNINVCSQFRATLYESIYIYNIKTQVNPMIKIAICDGSILERSSLYEMTVRYCTAHSIEAGLDLYSSATDLLASGASGEYAIIFMEFQPEDLLGIEAIQQIRMADPDTILISCCASEAASDGFPVHTDGCLTRPIAYPCFAGTLDSCQALLRKNTKSLQVMSERLPIEVLQKSIIYVEVTNSLCMIHTGQGIVQTYCSLADLERELPSPPFLRCHRSYLINMKYVDIPLDRDFQLKDGSIIPISKKNKTRIRQAYYQFLWNQAD